MDMGIVNLPKEELPHHGCAETHADCPQHVHHDPGVAEELPHVTHNAGRHLRLCVLEKAMSDIKSKAYSWRGDL